MNRGLFPLLAGLFLAAVGAAPRAAPAPPDGHDEDQIEIVEGEDRTIYEYRQNGLLTMIKIVPDKGRPYYMVPVDGAPRYEGLDHGRNLYPQWVIVEW